ncbi:MAG: alginate export family protein [Proteobacteria bacterium]|nr:alginate export family protein [Pseudomonadota bacterium]MBU1648936.1 alginate export family protein [Pseudomonadota bacterium]
MVPHQTPKGITTRRREIEAMQLPQSLTYQYAYGSDTTEITYLKNRDLNSRVQDDSVILGPNLFGIITYRPNAWLETTLEMRVEQLIAAQEETQVILPDGTVQVAEKKRLSLLVDQAHVTFKEVGPFNVTVGRRNFEDGRLWLYDAPLDGLIVKLKQGDVHTEASVTRENYFDGELLYSAPRGKINNYMLYTEYRGIEDSTLAAYAIKRDDTTGQEGEPLHLGMRAYGRPTDNFNYWTELGFSRGRDELKQKLKGYAFDVGGTYRFLDLPLQPSATLRYAFGSGDSSQDDNTNHEFRQTGLQSNEGKFGGVTQFKTYGEMLDPELTNLKILTAGVGCRPAENTFVDLVYNHYQLAEMASGELFSSGLTALMNLDDEHLSKDVGSEIDLILGFRNLFGLRGVGFDLRMGWFFPGKAYRLTDGDPADPTFRKADQAVSVLAVFIF